MPKRKKNKLSKGLIKPQSPPKPEDLEEFIREAGEVKILTTQTGWRILERDLYNFRDSIASRLAYVDPSRVEHKEARILFIAIDKLFALVDDYEANKGICLDMLNKLRNPDLAIPLDMDNEIGKGVGESKDGY